jgi:uncharacterized membrane protein
MNNFERFVNFSDAVIAIVVTLLVLPLVERATTAHVSSYGQFNATFGSLLFIFLLSFVVICRYWEVHHDLFNNLKTFNAALFWLNVAWLISIALIPFTSELLGNNSGSSSFITSLYIASLLVTSYVSVAIQVTITHSPQLQRPGAAKSLDKTYGVASAIAMTLALIISIILPSVGTWALLLLIPASQIGRRWQAKRDGK